MHHVALIELSVFLKHGEMRLFLINSWVFARVHERHGYSDSYYFALERETYNLLRRWIAYKDCGLSPVAQDKNIVNHLERVWLVLIPRFCVIGPLCNPMHQDALPKPVLRW